MGSIDIRRNEDVEDCIGFCEELQMVISCGESVLGVDL